MLGYCSGNNKTTHTNALMSLIRRIETNSSAIRELVKVSIDNNSTSYLKLSIGLLLRSCLLDCILGLYLLLQDEDSVLAEMERDYVKSLPDRFEVYADREGLSGMDESLLKHIYGLQIEDQFCEQIDWSSLKSGFFSIRKESKLSIKTLFNKLKSDSRLAKLSKKLYAYYKEYSQYEHFSLYGHRDSLSHYDEDSTSMAKAFQYVCEAMHFIVVRVDVESRLKLSSYSQHCCIEVLKNIDDK